MRSRWWERCGARQPRIGTVVAQQRSVREATRQRNIIMSNTTLQSLFVDELRDLYHAEKQLVRALPKLAKAATSPDLTTAIEKHLGETEAHVTRLERAFEMLDEAPNTK